MTIYRVSWAWQNSQAARFAEFDDALEFAGHLLETETFGNGREAPRIANTLNEDYDSDGLTEQQREAAEAIGLEVTGG